MSIWNTRSEVPISYMDKGRYLVVSQIYIPLILIRKYPFRLSLDPADLRQGTTVSHFSCISQPTRYSSSSKHTQQPLGRSHDHTHDQSHDQSRDQLYSQSHDILNDTLTDLDSITLGSPTALKRTDSGICA